ncbi:MAG TPA: protein lplB [Clostridiales bacterium]|nr:protein lplB [Clostridiales bacterium]
MIGTTSGTAIARQKQKVRLRGNNLQLHLMLLPEVILVLIFCYIPMYGIVLAFQNFQPVKGLFGSQEWVGLSHFIYAFRIPDTLQIVKNTVFIASLKIILSLLVPIFFAILLNEVVSKPLKTTFQTIVYLPYFLSWVLLGGILIDILSLSGLINTLISSLGIKPVYFLGEPAVFPWTVILSDIWKNFGYGTIVYVAAITNINPELYEVAELDGANWRQRTWHITVPGIRAIVILMATLSIGGILNAGFEQIYMLYSPQVYSTGDIIDTFVYRMGLLGGQYSFSTAVGLMKSFVSFILIGITYYFSYKFNDYRIF